MIASYLNESAILQKVSSASDILKRFPKGTLNLNDIRRLNTLKTMKESRLPILITIASDFSWFVLNSAKYHVSSGEFLANFIVLFRVGRGTFTTEDLLVSTFVSMSPLAVKCVKKNQTIANYLFSDCTEKGMIEVKRLFGRMDRGKTAWQKNPSAFLKDRKA